MGCVVSIKHINMSTYIIVGATSGIGKEIAVQLTGRGEQVISISRSAEGPEGAQHISADITEDELPLVEIPDGCAGLIYCPGSINLKPIRSLKVSDFEEDMGINFTGAVRAVKQLLPKLEKGRASILFFSTVAVRQGMPFHTSVAAAKGAIEGFARSLAAELAPDIRVNCIAPSLTDTPMAGRLLGNEARRKASEDRHPLKRVGTPSDIASAALHLLSSDASWITGQVMGVDGGMSTLRV